MEISNVLGTGIIPARVGFWGDRTGWRQLKQLLFLEPLPGGSRWAAAFGSLLLFTFGLQTGYRHPINLQLRPIGGKRLPERQVHPGRRAPGMVHPRCTTGALASW